MDAELDTTFVRRVKIIYLLQSGIQISRRDLARRFGVSDVAIGRDVIAIPAILYYQEVCAAERETPRSKSGMQN